MVLDGPLTRFLYSRDAPVVGSMTKFSWCFTCRFVAITATCCAIGSTLVPFDLSLYRCVACGRSYLSPVQWTQRRCFTISFEFLVYFSLVTSNGWVYWVGMGSFCSLSLDYLSGSNLGGVAVWSSTLRILELFFISGDEGVVSASLFGIWVSS